MLNISFKGKKTDLKSDLKEEPDLKRRCYFTLFERWMPESAEICPNVAKYPLICVTL